MPRSLHTARPTRAPSRTRSRGPSFRNVTSTIALLWRSTLKAALIQDLKLETKNGGDALTAIAIYLRCNGSRHSSDSYRLILTNPVRGLDPSANSADKPFGVYFQDTGRSTTLHFEPGACAVVVGKRWVLPVPWGFGPRATWGGREIFSYFPLSLDY